jgi:hypothetical protein
MNRRFTVALTRWFARSSSVIRAHVRARLNSYLAASKVMPRFVINAG